MNDQVLTILKGCLLAILYLFLARVVWVVNRELRGTPLTSPVPTSVPEPRPVTKQRSDKSSKGWRLVVHEPAARRGETVAIDTEITIGRGGGCALSLADDTFASNLHARAFVRNDALLIEDLGSTNGTLVNGSPLREATTLRKGDRVTIGQAELEVQR